MAETESPATAPTGTVAGGLPAELLAWLHQHDIHRRLVDAGRTDRDHGQPLPNGLARLLQDILDAGSDTKVTDFGHAGTTTETIEAGYRRIQLPLALVAESYGIAERRLRRWCHKGQVRARQDGPGCNWHVDPESVEEHLRRTRGQTDQPRRRDQSSDREEPRHR